MSLVEWSVDENVALLSMNSGDNRFNPAFCSEMLAALDQIEKTTSVSALVVKSTHEKIWSNGMDLDWLVPAMKRKDPDVEKFLMLQDKMMERLLFYPMITVAALTGHAFASGAIFACCFDFRFMRSDRGFLCFPEVDINIPFAPYMTGVIRKALPMYIVEEAQLTGKRFTASELEQFHFIRKACEADLVVKESIAFASSHKKNRDTLGKIKSVLHKDIAGLLKLPNAVSFDPDNTPIK